MNLEGNIAENNNITYSYSTTQNIEDENKLLKKTIFDLKSEIDRYRTPALMVADVCEVLGDTAIIKIPNGNRFLVNISSSIIDLTPGDTVAVEQRNLTIVNKLKRKKNHDVYRFIIMEKPTATWQDVGGLNEQIKELKEVIELPLNNPELFKKIGIKPPKGVLLYGPPGTGKTLLAKAVANSTNSTFIELVASELVQKFIGEGARLVKEIFELARENAPSIVFIDELDALAAKRMDIGTSGEREVQRTFMQLLAELDGFKPLDNVKIIGCTNRKDILDPAILRPGRLDRLIEVTNPDYEGVKQIFEIHTRGMNIDREINHETICINLSGLNGAEIKAVVTEAGYFAIREKRTVIFNDDFLKAINKVKKGEEDNTYLEMFG
ncbi:MAG: proteasome-activating nucleotidase [Candidatus Woesearchaeota archaeon]